MDDRVGTMGISIRVGSFTHLSAHAHTIHTHAVSTHAHTNMHTYTPHGPSHSSAADISSNEPKLKGEACFTPHLVQ